MNAPPPLPEPDTIRRGLRLLQPLMLWHRYRVEGMDHVPAEGGVLMVIFHSFATYDGFLLGAKIYEETGRLGRGLGDDRIFQTPWLADKARAVGLVPASPDAGLHLLQQGELLGVAPGGMWESLRPSTERYRLRWGDRRGFCRLAIRAQVPLMICACPAADEVYTLRPSRLTDAVYQRIHWPVPMVRGLGPTLVPRPVQLTHHIAPLIEPPPFDESRLDADADALFDEAKAVMEELLIRHAHNRTARLSEASP